MISNETHDADVIETRLRVDKVRRCRTKTGHREKIPDGTFFHRCNRCGQLMVRFVDFV